MRKMLFIMNPYAGTRRANRYLPDILSLYSKAGYDVTVHMTAGPGDCLQTVLRLVDQADVVVCAGGDGTLNETVNGILQKGRDVPIGYIPCGSTNDFAASLKLPTNVMKAAQLILEGTPQRLDVGLFQDRYFTYVASFGAFTRASYSTPQSVKNALGHLAYILGGIQELSQLKSHPVHIELPDREIQGSYLFGAVSNSTSVGGILSLDPKQVDMTDGKFELLLVRAPKDIGEINGFIRALQTKKYNCGMMTFLTTEALTVHTDAQMPWTLDGERAEGQSCIRIENLHHAVQIITRDQK